MPQNRAAELLKRIDRETAERAQMSLLLTFITQALVTLALGVLFFLQVPVIVYVAGLIIGETVLAGMLIVAMARLDSVIAGGLARAGLVEAARAPAVWYQGREWRILGIE